MQAFYALNVNIMCPVQYETMNSVFMQFSCFLFLTFKIFYFSEAEIFTRKKALSHFGFTPFYDLKMLF